MRLVLDTNILVSALVKNSLTREILAHPEMEYAIPEFALQELEAHLDELLEKSGLTLAQFALLLGQLKGRMVVVPSEDIRHREEARRVMDRIDPEDTVFIALALSIPNDGIWSQDRHFERQRRIKVWKTRELARRLGVTHA